MSSLLCSGICWHDGSKMPHLETTCFATLYAVTLACVQHLDDFVCTHCRCCLCTRGVKYNTCRRNNYCDCCTTCWNWVAVVHGCCVCMPEGLVGSLVQEPGHEEAQLACSCCILLGLGRYCCIDNCCRAALKLVQVVHMLQEVQHLVQW